MYKVIVAHPHQQHSYQLAAGLKSANMLSKYITTVYNKPGSFTKKIIPFLKGEIKRRAFSRKTDALNDSDVLQFCELYGLIYLLIMRLTHNNKRILDPYNRFVSKRFGRKVAAYAIKTKVDAVICFDTECEEMFSLLKKKAPHILRIMDASAINRLYLKQIYEKDMLLFPEFANRLKTERPELFSNDSSIVMSKLKHEIELTDCFLSPSKIVDDSFAYSGVDRKNLLRCPYGVELSNFNYVSKTSEKKSLNAIYVGGIKELKGIGCLVKAFSQIPTEIAQLTIVGMGNINDDDIRQYNKNIIFTGHVIHEEIVNLLQNADVFVFPSLGDSFGLAVLEAMSCGIPSIVSTNAGISEYIKNEENGFIIPPFSIDKIIECVMCLYDNPDLRIQMGQKASMLAKGFTWEKYRRNVAAVITNAIRQKKGE